jgi:hypothetical protein
LGWAIGPAAQRLEAANSRLLPISALRRHARRQNPKPPSAIVLRQSGSVLPFPSVSDQTTGDFRWLPTFRTRFLVTSNPKSPILSPQPWTEVRTAVGCGGGGAAPEAPLARVPGRASRPAAEGAVVVGTGGAVAASGAVTGTGAASPRLVALRSASGRRGRRTHASR